MIILNSSTQIQRSDIIKNFKDAQVPTRFFTRSHLTDALDAQKQAYLETAIDKMIPLNTDLRPYGFVYCLLMEQAKFYPGISIDLKPLRSSVLTGCVFIIALLGFLIPRKKSVFVLTNTAILGFLSIGSSAIIYLAFQFTSGALFWKLGLLVGILMIGLSIGNLLLANTAKKITITTRHFAWLFVLWFIFCLETLFWIHYEIPGILMEIVWYVMALECGILTGLGYPLASGRPQQ
jgi:hypothetical protein